MPSYPPVPPKNGSDFTKTTHHDTYPSISPTQSPQSGKYIFITGASKGIGRATALSFARAGAGGLALGARSSLSTLQTEILAAAKEAGHPAPTVLTLNLDVTNSDDVDHAAKAIEREFGRLDVLVNNAGYLSPWSPLASNDSTEWWRNYEVNIKGLFLVTKAVLPLMLKSGEKTIVNLTSIGGLGMRPGASGYQSTKFAVLRLTEFVMVDYAEEGVLAYSVHPGGVMTELAQNMPGETHTRLLIDKPELAGDTICFLTSERREWLAGRYISCNWDMPEFLSREEEIVQGDKLKMRIVL